MSWLFTQLMFSMPSLAAYLQRSIVLLINNHHWCMLMMRNDTNFNAFTKSWEPFSKRWYWVPTFFLLVHVNKDSTREQTLSPYYHIQMHRSRFNLQSFITRLRSSHYEIALCPWRKLPSAHKYKYNTVMSTVNEWIYI